MTDSDALKNLYSMLTEKLIARAESDKRYDDGDFDPDTLRLEGALDNNNLPLMMAYSNFCHRFPLKHIEGAMYSLTALKNRGVNFSPLGDEHIVQHAVIHSAFTESKKLPGSKNYFMSIDVDAAVQYVYEHPEDLSFILAAIGRGYWRLKGILEIVKQMRIVNSPVTNEGVL